MVSTTAPAAMTRPSVSRTPVTRVPERVLNPFLGKSLVVYLRHAGR